VHNGNLIPVNGRYLLVAAWYGGGTSVIDFTNPSSPQEVAYYDAQGPPSSDAWSSYWYNGKIYANDIGRGQDVFDIVLPSTQFGATFTHLNAQTQEDLLPSISATPSLSQLIGHRRALTGRWARQERHRRVTARGRASLSRARG
jgi:hypothetical protein